MALGKEMGRLQRLPIFACLDADALRLIAFSAELRTLPPGHLLFRRGDPADGAALLASGVLALDAEHEHDLSVRWVGVGTLLDETALLAPGIRSATATADEAATVVSIPRGLMMRVLNAYPSNVPALRRYCAARLRRQLASVRLALDHGALAAS